MNHMPRDYSTCIDAGKVLAIIPARGGSKRIPRKNLRRLCGLPLIVHTVRHAQKARLVQRVIVSTEDDEIAGAARSAGAEVVIRPLELATDSSPSEAALLHVLEVLNRDEQYMPDLVVFLQCTSPLRAPDDIDRALETLISKGADSLFSAFRSHRSLWRLEGGELRSTSYDHRDRKPRQAMPVELEENGSIYVMRTEILRKTANRLGGKIAVYEMSLLDSFQVDSEDEWIVIEQLFRLRRRCEAVKALRHIELLALDFDGVLTDNRVLVSQDGSESVWCHRGDGRGISLLKERGIPVAVISQETNLVVEARCRKLDIPFYQGCKDKLEVLERLVSEFQVRIDKVAYIGNDLSDLECMKAAGVSIAVADASEESKAQAQFITEAMGGHGAVREVIDWIIEGRTTCPG